ncbi:MAG: hypothetical protein FJW34_00665 [Acidobacteria bacterium]|nr:hypothetical protein [Acidobacteriota bacterium]
MHWAAERRRAHSVPEPVPPDWLATDVPLLWLALAGISRRRWLAVTVWAALTAASGAYLWWKPVIYSAEAGVLVEAQPVPAGLIPATTEPRLEERVNGARQKLLSNSHLLTVIEQLGLRAAEREAGIAASALAAEMRQSIAIQPVVPGAYGRSGLFRVAFKASDPRTAARVANHLAGSFAEEVSAARHSSSLAATGFYSSQVRSAQSNLERLETALRDFRVRHSAELPEQAESLRSSARRLRDELASLREQALVLERDKRSLQQPEAARRPPASADAQQRPPAFPVGMVGAPPRGGTQAEDLRKRLTALLVIYKPEHPDVRRLAAELATAERSEAEANGSRRAEIPSIPPKPDPGSAREDAVAVAARVRALEDRLEALAARRVQAAAELSSIEERLQRVPLRQQELAALTREYTLCSEQFRNLAAKQQSAKLAEALERDHPPERVTVLDQAQPSSRPLGPDRWLVWIAVTLGALVAGCLVAIASDCESSVWIGSRGRVPAMAREGDQDLMAEPDWRAPETPAKRAGSLKARRL